MSERSTLAVPACASGTTANVSTTETTLTERALRAWTRQQSLLGSVHQPAGTREVQCDGTTYIVVLGGNGNTLAVYKLVQHDLRCCRQWPLAVASAMASAEAA